MTFVFISADGLLLHYLNEHTSNQITFQGKHGLNILSFFGKTLLLFFSFFSLYYLQSYIFYTASSGYYKKWLVNHMYTGGGVGDAGNILKKYFSKHRVTQGGTHTDIPSACFFVQMSTMAERAGSISYMGAMAQAL